MRYELHRPGTAAVIPLVGDVEALDRAKEAREDRDESILQLLRDKLKDRGSRKQALDAVRKVSEPTGGPEDGDKYEPQRLNRKILWQYDSTARKVPLLRRHYI